MIHSRLRENPSTLFDVFVEVAAPPGSDPGGGESEDVTAFVLWQYPEDFSDESRMKNILRFSYPCEIRSTSVQHFCFVDTDESGVHAYGFCRFSPQTSTCICLYSALPWPQLFFRLLDHTADLIANASQDETINLLVNAYHQEIPLPGHSLVVESSIGRHKLEAIVDDISKLPRIPDNKFLTDYYNSVDETNRIALFAAMLHERRIIVTAERLETLTSCVLAANALIYPMCWQYVLVAVLPRALTAYGGMPMPFLIGVPKHYLHHVMRFADPSETVVLDVDDNSFRSPFADADSLPFEAMSILKKQLRSASPWGDGQSRAFLRALVVLIGSYRSALVFRQGEPITFDLDAFIASRPPSLRPFVASLRQLQIFTQFIDHRLALLNGDGLQRDEFEEECNIYSDKDFSKFKYQYAEWRETAKKESSKLITQVQERVRDRVKDLNTMIRDFDAPSLPSRPAMPSTSQLRRFVPSGIKAPNLPGRRSKQLRHGSSSEWHDDRDTNNKIEEYRAATETLEVDAASEHTAALERGVSKSNLKVSHSCNELLTRLESEGVVTSSQSTVNFQTGVPVQRVPHRESEDLLIDLGPPPSAPSGDDVIFDPLLEPSRLQTAGRQQNMPGRVQQQQQRKQLTENKPSWVTFE